MHIALAGGKLNFRIKKYTEYNMSCKNCRAFDLEVEIFMDCFHLYYIPFFSLGNKTAKIHCKNCNQIIKNESLENDYKKKTRTPFYFFIGTIFFTLLFTFAFIYIIISGKEDLELIENPRKEDIYLIQKKINDSTYNYSFLKVAKIDHDTVTVYPNSEDYPNYPLEIKPGDDFIKEKQMWILKSDLKYMLENDEISYIYRRGQ